MSIEAGVETVPVAADNAPLTSHIICGTCYPEPPPMGTPSLCGERVLGTRPQPGKPKCEKCPKLKWEHYCKYHSFGGR
jgi:hypothetical protein